MTEKPLVDKVINMVATGFFLMVIIFLIVAAVNSFTGDKGVTEGDVKNAENALVVKAAQIKKGAIELRQDEEDYCHTEIEMAKRKLARHYSGQAPLEKESDVNRLIAKTNGEGLSCQDFL